MDTPNQSTAALTQDGVNVDQEFGTYLSAPLVTSSGAMRLGGDQDPNAGTDIYGMNDMVVNLYATTVTAENTISA